MNLHAFLIKVFGEGDLSGKPIEIVTRKSKNFAYVPTILSKTEVFLQSAAGSVSLRRNTEYKVIEVFERYRTLKLKTVLVISQEG